MGGGSPASGWPRRPSILPFRSAFPASILAFSEAVHTPSPAGRIQALEREVSSLRATYESEQFARVEEEDGVWCLRMNLEFATRGEALNALSGILGIVE